MSNRYTPPPTPTILWQIEIDYYSEDRDRATHTRVVYADPPTAIEDAECCRDTIPSPLYEWTYTTLVASYTPGTVAAVRFSIVDPMRITAAGCGHDTYGHVIPDTGGVTMTMHNTEATEWWGSSPADAW